MSNLRERRNADFDGAGRMMVLQGVMEMIEKAELFASPPGKYAARNRDAKGVVYLALVVLKCVGEGRKAEEVVQRLGAGEFFFFGSVLGGWGDGGMGFVK